MLIHFLSDFFPPPQNKLKIWNSRGLKVTFCLGHTWKGKQHPLIVWPFGQTYLPQEEILCSGKSDLSGLNADSVTTMYVTLGILASHLNYGIKPLKELPAFVIALQVILVTTAKEIQSKCKPDHAVLMVWPPIFLRVKASSYNGLQCPHDLRSPIVSSLISSCTFLVHSAPAILASTVFLKHPGILRAWRFTTAVLSVWIALSLDI